MPLLMLLLFSIAVSIVILAVIFVIFHSRRRQSHQSQIGSLKPLFVKESVLHNIFICRPTSWVAVKCRSLLTVQSALGLHNPKPCSFLEGLSGNDKLFIAPPINGWILVIGAGLPDPREDVDTCFRFVLDLSRKLGEVQFFSASPVLHDHAWVRAARGRIVRAYAWAGRTLWKQGARTAAESDLGLRCFDYADPSECEAFSEPDVIVTNMEKVPLLAARWSLNPSCIDERFLEQERGIAGEPSQRF